MTEQQPKMVKHTDELTVKQERYVNLLAQGYTQREAYIKAYNPKTLKKGSIDNYASDLFRQPKVYARYTELLAEMREREKEKTGWTREQSIQTLKFVIDTNRKDIERIQQAAEDELTFLLNQIQKHPEDAVKLTKEALNNRKRVRATMTNNNAIISATSELNKMQGYNEQNINLNGTVVFSDEEKLEE